MRINNQTLLSFLLVFALPSLGATLGGSSANVGVEVNPDVAESYVASPADTAQITSWANEHQITQIKRRTDDRASFMSPSYILDGIQNAYFPSVLRMTGIVQAFIEPKPSSPVDFWDLARESEEKLQAYVHSLLEAAATYFKSTHFTDIMSTMNHIVNATAAFRDNIQAVLDDQHISIDTLTEELEGIFMRIVDDLEKIPPPDKAPGHAERAEMVDKVLDDTTQAFIKLAARYGIEEEVVTAYLLTLKPHLEALIVAVGDINEQHPQLLPGLAFSVAVLLIPEAWILRPFLSIFGFGPAGPIKGSAAAWMQRYFWGAAVEASSWFSWLQAAGMGVLPKWAWLVTKFPLLIAGVLAMLLPCVVRG